MSELERTNSKGSIQKSSDFHSLADHLLQAAARAEVVVKDLNDEEDYIYPSGKVKWEDTIEGWEESERNKIKESSDHYSLGKDMREWEEKYKPWVFGGKNPDVSMSGNHTKSEKRSSVKSGQDKFLKNSQDLDKAELSIPASGYPPRPSDHIEYRIKKWEEQKEKQKPENDEVESIAHSLLDGRLLDRIKKSEERERESDERLVNQIDSTLSLENKRNNQNNSG